MTTIRCQVAAAAMAVGLGVSLPANAQDGETIDVEVPVLILDTGGEGFEESDEELDLANVVQSAAKGVTTVQEAPAIVTVITGDDIAARGFTQLDDIIDTVPGWLRVDAIHGQVPFGTARGTVQSMLYMHNGVSLFAPWDNTVVNVDRRMPLELVKRIEFVTGPGGVLWGANSFLGIVNVITKDADDVDGIETDVRIGDGPGDQGVLRGHVLAGLPEFLHEKVSLLAHASFETWEGPRFKYPQHLFSTPLPNPNSQLIYGPLTESNVDRSMMFQLNGKLTVSGVDVNVQAPILLERHLPVGFPGVVTQAELPEDSYDLGDPANPDDDCAFEDVHADPVERDTNVGRPSDRCVDRGRLGRDDQFNWMDRYVTASYRTRFADNKAGATVKLYGIQFVRDWQQLNIIAPSALLEGGLSFQFDSMQYRIGGSYDGDYELPGNVRMLYGAEAFREWVPHTLERSRQGRNGIVRGTEARVIGPVDLARIPLACPREPDPSGGIRFVPNCPMTMIFETDRAVVGAYANPQWRPSRRLILDAGVRAQAAPDALGEASYPLQLIFSGAAVYELTRNWHAKVNYAEGFRPPVFNNTDSNGESIQIDGSRDIEVENSQAIQGEINARLFKGQRRLREVNFRADYSYTTIQNLIQLVGGRYENTADRGIHSVEFLGKVFLKGGHQVELGYTYLKVATEDIGWLSAMPEHWFNLSGVFNLVDDRLQAATLLKVYGAQEDPNRIVEWRDLTPVLPGELPDDHTVFSQPHELTMERLPPGADLSVGLTWLDAFGVDKLRAKLFAFNAFNSLHYFPDVFHSYEPRLEFFGNQRPGFRAIASLTYLY